MSRKIRALVCVAHPDDETIFFGGLIASKKYDWSVICVTDGNADGLGASRAKQFRKACALLGASHCMWLSHRDDFAKRLNVDLIVQELSSFGPYDKVFTHGILGEYGHPHHQDVSYAVHKNFYAQSKVYSVAYNTYPTIKISLAPKVFALKSKILSKIYENETKRFLNFLPCTQNEGFLQVDLDEVEEIYKFILGQKKLSKNKIPRHRWLFNYIENREFELKHRPF